MKFRKLNLAWLLAGLISVGFSGCNGGGGGDNSGYQTGTSQSTPNASNGAAYTVANLVSDGGVAAANTDPNLVNAWGLAFNPKGFVWVAAAGTSKSTLYSGSGVPQSLVVSIPGGVGGAAKPTGIVFNGSQEFKVSQSGVTAASPFLFVGEAGTLSGWSPSVNATQAVTVYDGGGNGSIYKGLALASRGGANHLYAADFHNGNIDVFDGNFAKVSVPGGFRDAGMPAGYAPFGIQAINNSIYVAYAKQDAQAEDEVAGAGLGMIDVFDSDGNLLRRLVSAGQLNAPWGMALAPADFGAFSNALLVANFGDGKINAFDPTTGQHLGTLSKDGGAPIVIDGLWGIAFGNGINNQPTNSLFFTAGPADETHGLYGRIDIQ